MQAIFSQEYLLYFKEKWRGTAGKDLLFGHIDGFQIDPSISLFDFLCNGEKNYCRFYGGKFQVNSIPTDLQGKNRGDWIYAVSFAAFRAWAS